MNDNQSIFLKVHSLSGQDRYHSRQEGKKTHKGIAAFAGARGVNTSITSGELRRFSGRPVPCEGRGQLEPSHGRQQSMGRGRPRAARHLGLRPTAQGPRPTSVLGFKGTTPMSTSIAGLFVKFTFFRDGGPAYLLPWNVCGLWPSQTNICRLGHNGNWVCRVRLPSSLCSFAPCFVASRFADNLLYCWWVFMRKWACDECNHNVSDVHGRSTAAAGIRPAWTAPPLACLCQCSLANWVAWRRLHFLEFGCQILICHQTKLTF